MNPIEKDAGYYPVADEVQVTVWCDPHEILNTQYGKLTCLDWLHREAARIEAKNVATRIRENAGKYALFTLSVPKE